MKTGLACCVVSALAIGLTLAGHAGAMTEAEARETLDNALRYAAEQRYEEAVETFESVREANPGAIESIDGLRIAVVYAKLGDVDVHEDHIRWLIGQFPQPELATDADRAVKGYIVFSEADDPELLAYARELAVYATDAAGAVGEEEYMGFFNITRGIAEYRLGNYEEASEWVAKSAQDPSKYIRGLALVYYAMAEHQRGNVEEAADIFTRAEHVVAELPEPGTEEYLEEWTDTLFIQLAYDEAQELME